MTERDPVPERRLQAMVSAALSGHDLEPFEPQQTSNGGFRSRCRLCGQSIWLGDNGLILSHLEDDCPTTIV